MTIRPFFKLCDAWIGAYYDKDGQALYVCPLPFFGVKFCWAPKTTAGAVTEQQQVVDDVREYLRLYGTNGLSTIKIKEDIYEFAQTSDMLTLLVRPDGGAGWHWLLRVRKDDILVLKPGTWLPLVRAYVNERFKEYRPSPKQAEEE